MKRDYKLSITDKKYYEKLKYSGETWQNAKKRIENRRIRLALKNSSVV